MTFYIGVNSDGTEILSKQSLKRYIDYHTNEKDVLSFNDTQQPPHWMLDYTGVDVPRNGVNPIDTYLTLPSGSIKRMFGIDMTWDDEFKTIEL